MSSSMVIRISGRNDQFYLLPGIERRLECDFHMISNISNNESDETYSEGKCAFGNPTALPR